MDRSDSTGDSGDDYQFPDNNFELPERTQRAARVKRHANLGQKMGHEMGQGRVRRRINQIDQARNRNGSKEEDYEQLIQFVVTPRGAITGIKGLTEDLPEQISNQEKCKKFSSHFNLYETLLLYFH